MREGSRELLASRGDVWGFLSEPYHLSDWWPGITGVDPDRRGFADGARWQVMVVEGPGSLLPWVGRPSGRAVVQTLLITGIAPYELWSFRLVPHDASSGIVRTIDVCIRLEAIGSDRTRVRVEVGGTRFDRALFGSRNARLAQVAADRLFDLVQTAATL